MGYRMRNKVYVISNYDGRHEVAVVAANLASAARRAGTSVYSMRTMGYRVAAPGTDGSEIINDHTHLYRRSIDGKRHGEPFVRWLDVLP